MDWHHQPRAVFLRFALTAVLLCASESVYAQSPRALTLESLTRNSGLIFSGVVTRIERVRAAAPGAVESVRVSFRVSNAVRGVRQGEVVEVSEWAGLWASGERYRLGQQVVLFLHAPSKMGLTSPVGGDFGRFLVDKPNGGQIGLQGARGRRFSIYRKFIYEKSLVEQMKRHDREQ
jgi:hypothetical protein